jgi:hypothetical protein
MGILPMRPAAKHGLDGRAPCGNLFRTHSLVLVKSDLPFAMTWKFRKQHFGKQLQTRWFIEMANMLILSISRRE